MKTKSSPALPRNAIMRAALAKLNECRAKCPGIGGDVDAMNLSCMIDNGTWFRSTTDQAAHTLEHLSKGLKTSAADEVAALRALPLFEAAPNLLQFAVNTVIAIEEDGIEVNVSTILNDANGVVSEAQHP